MSYSKYLLLLPLQFFLQHKHRRKTLFENFQELWDIFGAFIFQFLKNEYKMLSHRDIYITTSCNQDGEENCI